LTTLILIPLVKSEDKSCFEEGKWKGDEIEPDGSTTYTEEKKSWDLSDENYESQPAICESIRIIMGGAEWTMNRDSGKAECKVLSSVTSGEEKDDNIRSLLCTLAPTSSPTNNPTISLTTMPTESPTWSPTPNPYNPPTTSPTPNSINFPTSTPTNASTPTVTNDTTPSPTFLSTFPPTHTPAPSVLENVNSSGLGGQKPWYYLLCALLMGMLCYIIFFAYRRMLHREIYIQTKYAGALSTLEMMRMGKNENLTPSFTARATPTFESTCHSWNNVLTPSEDKNILNAGMTVENINYSNAALYEGENLRKHHDETSKPEYKREATGTYDDETISECNCNPNLQRGSTVTGEKERVIEKVTVGGEYQHCATVEDEEEADKLKFVYENPNTVVQLENVSTLSEESDLKLQYINTSSSDDVQLTIKQDHVSHAVEHRTGHALGDSKDSVSVIFNLTEYTEDLECTATKTEGIIKHELPPVPNLKIENGAIKRISDAILKRDLSMETTETSTDDTEVEFAVNDKVHTQVLEK